jgi:hypothetical protein
MQESIMKSPLNSGRELSHLLTQLFHYQMTRRTMEKPLPVPVVIPIIEALTVAPLLLRRGFHRTAHRDILWFNLAPAVK